MTDDVHVAVVNYRASGAGGEVERHLAAVEARRGILLHGLNSNEVLAGRVKRLHLNVADGY